MVELNKEVTEYLVKIAKLEQHSEDLKKENEYLKSLVDKLLRNIVEGESE